MASIPQISNGKCNDSLVEISSITKLEHLSNEMLLEIFEKCEFEEFVVLAETNNRFRDLISRYIMISNYHIEEQIVDLLKPDEATDKRIEHYGIGDDSIRIYSLRRSLMFYRIWK